VAVIRALAAACARQGTPAQRAAVRDWCRGLLDDANEKVRRYAADALAVLGVGPDDEAALVAALRRCRSEREERTLSRVLGKVGGEAALAALSSAERAAPSDAGGERTRDSCPTGSEASGSAARREAVRTISARMARAHGRGTVRLDAVLAPASDLRLHLRWRRGFEAIVAEEAAQCARGTFRIAAVRSGRVVLAPLAPFRLADVYRLRCFDSVAFRLPVDHPVRTRDPMLAVAHALTSAAARRVFASATDGPIRYRVAFAGRGRGRAAVRTLAARVHALWPELLNDPVQAPWTVEVARDVGALDLVPHVAPDPRLAYRRRDVPAASHPRLAACMARLAGVRDDEVVWDPFCGSGMELVERALLGGVRRVFGSDADQDAVRIAEGNFAAAAVPGVAAEFVQADFRAAAEVLRLDRAGISPVITNPPMGRRVPAGDVRATLAAAMAVAADVLVPGGRLVLPNPLRTIEPPPRLRLFSRRRVDFGGFDCQLEVYRRER
jgi:23S rRNA G2445 N2-methylase RlmL